MSAWREQSVSFDLVCLLRTYNLTTSLERGYPKTLERLGEHIGHNDLPHLVNQFLDEQLNGSDSDFDSDSDSAIHDYDIDHKSLSVFHSAISTFYAPSDLSGVGGMHTEWIRACPNWRKSYPRYDTVLMDKDPEVSGFRGLHVARILLFFSFKYKKQEYPCALIHWFPPVQDGVDEDIGMYMVEPEFRANHSRSTAVVHLETIVRSAHLLPVFGEKAIRNVHFSDSLDVFEAFYVNKYADHHAFEII